MIITVNLSVSAIQCHTFTYSMSNQPSEVHFVKSPMSSVEEIDMSLQALMIMYQSI